MRRGFTLIELLIVVAIIAILAAIAVPNFLEAQTRAKVTRSKSDMRVLATAIESYRVDTNKYPTDCGNGAYAGAYRPYQPSFPSANFTIGFELTTPIAYLSSAASLRDPFKATRVITGASSGREYYCYANWDQRYKAVTNPGPTLYATQFNLTGQWVVMGAGPDRYVNNNTTVNTDFSNAVAIPRGCNYDSTNGTISNGDIYRSQKYSEGMPERGID